MCGWLKDRYGVSWQVTPRMMSDLFKEHTSGKAERAMEAMLRMKKIDIAELERATAEEPPAVVHRVRRMALRLRFPSEQRRYPCRKRKH
jgi:hypothetical protein